MYYGQLAFEAEGRVRGAKVSGSPIKFLESMGIGLDQLVRLLENIVAMSFPGQRSSKGGSSVPSTGANCESSKQSIRGGRGGIDGGGRGEAMSK